MPNHWLGSFPVKDLTEGGRNGTASMGCFELNAYRLFDMAGNVWKLTGTRANPYGGMKVAKGGCLLCSDDFDSRYRPAARTPHGIDTGMQHVRFRTVWRVSVRP